MARSFDRHQIFPIAPAAGPAVGRARVRARLDAPTEPVLLIPPQRRYLPLSTSYYAELDRNSGPRHRLGSQVAL